MTQYSMHPTDEAIAAAVQDGETHAFGTLVERYEPKITRYGRKFLSNPDDIADLVQGVFIKAYVNIRSFDAARRFSPWIYRIAHNEFVNALKKKSREPLFFFDSDTIFPHPVTPERADKETLDAELKETVSRSLEKLSSKYREVIVLYFFEDLSYADIADILHLPVSTVGVRLKRAKAELKKLCPELNFV